MRDFAYHGTNLDAGHSLSRANTCNRDIIFVDKLLSNSDNVDNHIRQILNGPDAFDLEDIAVINRHTKLNYLSLSTTMKLCPTLKCMVHIHEPRLPQNEMVIH